MISINVEVKGLSNIQRAIAMEPILAVKEISMAVKKSLVILQNGAVKEAPVNKSFGGGTLRQSIRGSMTSQLRGEVVASAPYASAVETGTRPHLIRPKVKQALANVRTGQFFGKLVHHPGTRANPFMERAVTRGKEEIAGFFRTGIQNIINTIQS